MEVCRLASCLLLLLLLTVHSLPVMLEDEQDVLLSVSEHGEPNEVLSCHTKEDIVEKTACCKEGLQAWRARQALYQDYDKAETERMVAPEATEELITNAETAKGKWDNSETKQIFVEGVRQCTNSPNPYLLPADTDATAARRQIQKQAEEKKRAAQAAKAASDSAIEKQGEAMADYVKVANEIDAENAKLNAAEAEAEKSNIDSAQAEEEVQLSQENARAAAQEHADAIDALQEAKKQMEGAQKALEDATNGFEKRKAELADRVKTGSDKEQQALEIRDTADKESQNAQDEYDSKTDEVEKAAALARVEEAKAEAEAKNDEALEATAEVNALQQAKEKLNADAESALAAMKDELKTAEQDVQMATAVEEQKAEAKDSADAQLARDEADQRAKKEAATAAAADSATAQGDLERAKAEKSNLKAKADAAATEAKTASDMQSVLEQEASEKQHAAMVAVKNEEQALSKSAEANRDAEAVKWDAQYDVIKQKVATVTDMYNEFVNCVKDSKWEC